MNDSALNSFISLANEIITELESAISQFGAYPKDYPNAEVALKNITAWRDRALNGTLAKAYYPNFGIGKSDLLFGKVEDKMYELEHIYTDQIMDREHFNEFFKNHAESKN